MNIDIICIGTLKEQYWRDAAAEYTKRLSAFAAVNIIELKESPFPKDAGTTEEAAVVLSESRALQNAVKSRSYTIALDLRGKQLSSEGLANKLETLMSGGVSRVSFLIGGSLGMSNELIDSVDLRLSFSQMTFPHQLMRVVLLEQIYRAFKINRGEPYHK